MTEIYQVGPYEKKDPRFFGEYYRENRALYKMEQEMEDSGFHFSFDEHVRQLLATFPGVINILDGGCGEGRGLGDLKISITALGREARTTGVDMQVRHIESAQGYRVDKLIVGTVRNAFQHGLLEENGYQFVLDFHGALGNPDVEKTLAIYGQVLAPKGTALLTMGGLDIAYPKNTSPYHPQSKRELEEKWQKIKQYKQGLEKVLQENSLEAVKAKSYFALLQKAT